MIKQTFKPLLFIVMITFFSCSNDDSPDQQITPISAVFTENRTELFEFQTVNFNANYDNNIDSWSWTFEGGNPATSSLKNPTVAYEIEGIYDVQLTVSNSETSAEITKQELIKVKDDLLNGLIVRALLDGDAIDSSGNDINGEIIGAVNPIQNRMGSASSAMSFNENEGFINFGNIEELEIEYDSKISISVWIKPNGNQLDWDTILNQYFEGPAPSADGRFYLGINPINTKVRWNVFGNHLESSVAIETTEWTHVVVDYQDSTMSMYINGSLDGTFQLGPGQVLLGTGAAFMIGRQSMTQSITTGFSGEIDDVYVFNRIIDENEITELYEAN
jgi:PKD repeat protein